MWYCSYLTVTTNMVPTFSGERQMKKKFKEKNPVIWILMKIKHVWEQKQGVQVNGEIVSVYWLFTQSQNLLLQIKSRQIVSLILNLRYYYIQIVKTKRWVVEKRAPPGLDFTLCKQSEMIPNVLMNQATI